MACGRLGFVDLCCGAGGFALGFKAAGWHAVLGIDNCRHSLATFERNLQSQILCCDLLAVGAPTAVKNTVGAARVDAVIAGPPCQGFSRAGKREAGDERNEIFIACARVAVRLDPQVIVFENVPNILHPKFEPCFSSAVGILRRNGYHAAYGVLNAQQFGIPQRRERLVLIAARRHSRSDLRGVIGTLLSCQSQLCTVEQVLQGLPLEPDDAARYHFHNHEPMPHSRKVREKIARIMPGTGPLSYRKLDPEAPAATLICGHRALPCHYAVPRTITVREAARIQGFPDSFVFTGYRGNQMLQVANAVPPPMATAIAEVVKHLVSGA